MDPDILTRTLQVGTAKLRCNWPDMPTVRECAGVAFSPEIPGPLFLDCWSQSGYDPAEDGMSFLNYAYMTRLNHLTHISADVVQFALGSGMGGNALLCGMKDSHGWCQ